MGANPVSCIRFWSKGPKLGNENCGINNIDKGFRDNNNHLFWFTAHSSERSFYFSQDLVTTAMHDH